MLGSTPPLIAATLDLSKPGERWAERFLRWASTGPRPLLKPLAISRNEQNLLVAVEWLDWPHDEPLALLEIALTGNSLRWMPLPHSERSRLLASLRPQAQSPEQPLASFGALLRHHRERAGLCRYELAAHAKLSWNTIRNIETGRTYPSRITLRSLLQVPDLALRAEELPPPLRGHAKPARQAGSSSHNRPAPSAMPNDPPISNAA
jgi:DNA-binding XRE family transcriptional regulator